MLKRFGDLKIGARVLIGMVAPIFGLLLFAGLVMGQRFGASQEMERVGNLAELAPTLSALVHELQKERGRSAGFIGSKGRTFADILPTQREATDEVRATTRTALEAFEFDAYHGFLEDSARTALENIEKLDQSRQAVDQFAVTVPEMAKYYTATIMSLIGTVEAMQLASSDDVVSKRISGYISFLQGKERAGRERAMGAAGFGSGAFKPQIYNKFVSLIGAQDLLFDEF